MGWDALPPGHVGWRQGGGEWRGKVAERWYAPWAGGEAGGIRLKPSELHLCSLYTAERKWVERCAAGARVKCRWGCRWDLLAREAGGGHAWCPDAHAARVLQRPPCTLCAHTCLPLRTQVFARSSEGGARRAPAHCYAPKGCSAPGNHSCNCHGTSSTTPTLRGAGASSSSSSLGPHDRDTSSRLGSGLSTISAALRATIVASARRSICACTRAGGVGSAAGGCANG